MNKMTTCRKCGKVADVYDIPDKPGKVRCHCQFCNTSRVILRENVDPPLFPEETQIRVTAVCVVEAVSEFDPSLEMEEMALYGSTSSGY